MTANNFGVVNHSHDNNNGNLDNDICIAMSITRGLERKAELMLVHWLSRLYVKWNFGETMIVAVSYISYMTTAQDKTKTTLCWRWQCGLKKWITLNQSTLYFSSLDTLRTLATASSILWNMSTTRKNLHNGQINKSMKCVQQNNCCSNSHQQLSQLWWFIQSLMHRLERDSEK